MRIRTKIVVSEDVIAEGMRRDATFCIIAEAIRRTLPDAKAIRVDLATIRWTDPSKNERYIYLTPLTAQQMIVDFDQGRGIDRLKPFTMRLRDVQIIKSRPATERENKGIGTGNGKGSRKPYPRTVTYQSDGSIKTVGGTPMPVADARSPERQRRYSARQLRP